MLFPYIGIAVNTFAAVTEREQAADQLQASKEQLQALFQALSHDFSTPLTVARMTLLSHEEDRVLTPKEFDRLSRSVHNLDKMLARFRSLANIFLRKKKLDLQAVDIRDLIERIQLNLEEPMRSKSIRIDYEDQTYSKNAHILGEPVVLEHQVFQNLIHNAMKFSMVGAVIRVSVCDGGLDQLIVRVTDEGVGIPQEKLNRLFSWNQTTSTTGTSGEVGTGFGLPTARLCLDTLGASMRVHSSSVVGKSGTTFELTFMKAAEPLKNEAVLHAQDSAA